MHYAACHLPSAAGTNPRILSILTILCISLNMCNRRALLRMREWWLHSIWVVTLSLITGCSTIQNVRSDRAAPSGAAARDRLWSESTLVRGASPDDINIPLTRTSSDISQAIEGPYAPQGLPGAECP